MALSPSARLYARPTGFIDAPTDGESCAQLAGGLQYFSLWEMLATEAGRPAGRWLVPVGDAQSWCADLSPAQAERLTQMMARATAPRAPLVMGSHSLTMDRPNIMAILNITPDSFSGGHAHLGDPAGSAQLAKQMAADGAAIIDLGGESTRPGAADVSEAEELSRILPVIDALRDSGLILSLDTRKSVVMKAGLASGAHIINDVSALLYDDQALEVLARSTCPIVLMHFPGPAQTPHARDAYHDPLTDVYDWLEARIEAVVQAGIARERLIADPGIGFGKASAADNLRLMNGLSLLHGLGVPILLGASRKRLIAALSDDAPTDQRLGGSIALALKAAEQGAQIIRVHDVYESAQAIRIWAGQRAAALGKA